MSPTRVLRALAGLVLLLGVFASSARAQVLVGSWTFDEGSGGAAGDGSGNGNTGTLLNGATWTTGKYGTGIQLDGATQEVQVASSPSLNVTGPGLTLATWIFPTAAQSGALMHKAGHYSLFRYASGAITYADSITWDYATIGSYGQTPLNTWSHVAVTFDGSAARFYVNGQLVGTAPHTGTLTANSSPLSLGNYAGSRFAGILDETRVYSGALTAAEVSALAGGGGAGLVGSWRFDEGSGGTAGDGSGNGNTGTLLNGATWTT